MDTGWRWVAVGLVATLGVAAGAGCGDGGDRARDAESDGGERVEQPDADEAESADVEAVPSGGEGADEVPAPEPVTPGQLPGAEREIVYTARLEVVADDVESAADDAARLVADAGGFVFDQTADLAGDDQQVSITFKLPPAVFDETLERLADLGRLEHRDVQTDDVTGQVVDVESRLASAQASAERLRALLAQAASVEDLVVVEQSLAQREAEVESLTAELRVLREQVDLASVTLALSETPADDDPEVSDDIPGFLDGLRNGGVAFVNVLQVVATAVGFLVPFFALAAVAGGGLVLVLRRRRQKQTA